MKNVNKYSEQNISLDSSEWSNKTYLAAAPQWCSIDLVDGNRAFTDSMTQYEKEEYFKMLCRIGIKQINIGNPSTQSDISFVNALIEKELIPDDTFIQINVYANRKNVSDALRAIRGINNVIINIRNMGLLTPPQDFFTFRKDSLTALRAVKDKMAKAECNLIIEYTVEISKIFDVNKAIQLFNEAADLLEPNKNHKVIFNISCANELKMPHIFASVFEIMDKKLRHRDGIILSFRPSNDRGTAVASAELALLAGVERIEGTLFGIGERAGNLDLVNLAMNLYSQGIDPQLELNNLPRIKEIFERFTGFKVPDNLPYSGKSSFSVTYSSHQRIISEALKTLSVSERKQWNIPYLPIDPRDIGTKIDTGIIKANTLSSHSGINYILNKKFGFQIPSKLRMTLAETIITDSDDDKTELNLDIILQRFESQYIDDTPVFTCPKTNFSHEDTSFSAETVIKLCSGNSFTVKSEGSGRLDAVGNALKKYFDTDFDIDIYEEHSLTSGSKSKVVAYVSIKCPEDYYWGVGINEDIIKASVNALAVAVNRIKKVRSFSVDTDPRVIEMLEFIKDNYDTVTLGDVANEFYLSKQYVSKYIKEKSGLTFCENVQKFRMKMAEEMLLTTNLTVETIAEKSGYPSVEHFNRKFKKLHGITPMQFRKKK